jgi:hypothetical protein
MRDAAMARPVTAYLRKTGERLARLEHHTGDLHVPLTGALWLGIAGVLTGTFVFAS